MRYYLLAAGTGQVERIDWWQLVAKGYGLCDPQADGALRERPSFAAFAALARQLAGTTCQGPLAAPEGVRAVRFTHRREEIVVAWSTAGALDWAPPPGVSRVVDRDGRELALSEAARLSASPRYLTRLQG